MRGILASAGYVRGIVQAIDNIRKTRKIPRTPRTPEGGPSPPQKKIYYASGYKRL